MTDVPTAEEPKAEEPDRVPEGGPGDAPPLLERRRTTWPVTFVLSGGVILEVPRKFIAVFTDAFLAELDHRLREAILGGAGGADRAVGHPLPRRGRPPKWASADTER